MLGNSPLLQRVAKSKTLPRRNLGLSSRSSSGSSDSFGDPFVEDERKARLIIDYIKKRTAVEAKIHEHPLYKFAAMVATRAGVKVDHLVMTERVARLPPRPHGYALGLDDSSDQSAVDRRERLHENDNTAMTVNDSIDLGMVRLAPMMEQRTFARVLACRKNPALLPASIDAFMYSETCNGFFADVVALLISEGQPHRFAREITHIQERMRAVLTNFTAMTYHPSEPVERQLKYDFGPRSKATATTSVQRPISRRRDVMQKLLDAMKSS